ncbi:MAG: DUF3857 domain-containing protein [Acetobacteraceae bacterium]|nr:DUF3857 domain-containing protein [Acetobacteraceae bacterium]
MLSLLCLLAAPAGAEPVVHARLDRSIATYTVNPALGYLLTSTQDWTLLTQRGLSLRDRATLLFYPSRQSVELVEAWVDQPDGTRVMVPPSSVFTRITPMAANVVGFVTSRTMTVLFPQLRIGSRTHVVWKMDRAAPALLGFNTFGMPEFEWDTAVSEIRIDLPATIPLTWRARGGYRVTDTSDGGMRHIIARITDQPGQETEPGMVNINDFMPQFQATSLPDFEAIGAITAQAARGTGVVVPALQTLADRIVGDLQDEAAARAIHDWVKTAIRPMVQILNPVEGFAPRPALAVLQAGFGDGRDMAVLTQALLAARGIPADLVLVEEGGRNGDPLFWTPFFINQAILYLPDFDRYVNMFSRFSRFDALQPNLTGKLAVHVTDGGRRARTPELTPAQSRYHARLRTSLDVSGTITGHADFEMSPTAEAYVRGLIADASSLEQLAGQAIAATPEGGSGSYVASNPRDLSQPLQLSADWISPRALNRLGGAMILQVPQGVGPLAVSGLRDLLRQTASGPRRTPVWVGARDYRWDVALTVPDGWPIARLPRDVVVENIIGRYEAQYRAEGQTIYVQRQLIVRRNVVAPDEYPALEALAYAPLEDTRGLVFLLDRE